MAPASPCASFHLDPDLLVQNGEIEAPLTGGMKLMFGNERDAGFLKLSGQHLLIPALPLHHCFFAFLRHSSVNMLIAMMMAERW